MGAWVAALRHKKCTNEEIGRKKRGLRGRETEGSLRKVKGGRKRGRGDSLGRCEPQIMPRVDQATIPRPRLVQLGLPQRKKLQREEGSVEGPWGLEHM